MQMKIKMQIFHKMNPGGKTDTGSCYALYAPKVASMNKIGEWNKVRLIIKPGNKVEHHMNGKLLCSYTMGSKDWQNRVNSSKFKNWELFAETGSDIDNSDVNDAFTDVSSFGVEAGKLKDDRWLQKSNCCE